MGDAEFNQELIVGQSDMRHLGLPKPEWSSVLIASPFIPCRVLALESKYLDLSANTSYSLDA